MIKEPHPIDIYVGRRLRSRRVEVGMSQKELGKFLGIASHQQIQKFENGTNRISLVRFYIIARVLGVSMDYFFEDLPDNAADGKGSGKPDS